MRIDKRKPISINLSSNNNDYHVYVTAINPPTHPKINIYADDGTILFEETSKICWETCNMVSIISIYG